MRKDRALQLIQTVSCTQEFAVSEDARHPPFLLRALPALAMLVWVGWLVWRDSAGRGLLFPLVVLGLWIFAEIAWTYMLSRDKVTDPMIRRFVRVSTVILLTVAMMLAWALFAAGTLIGACGQDSKLSFAADGPTCHGPGVDRWGYTRSRLVADRQDSPARASPARS